VWLQSDELLSEGLNTVGVRPPTDVRRLSRLTRPTPSPAPLGRMEG
jgi:hypothetical protein